MNRNILRFGGLIGLFLTAPLIGLMYLVRVLADLPFAPFDIFEWVTRVLPGPVVTLGIDLMIDTMRFLGVDVADNAKVAEQVMAVIAFYVFGIAISIAFYALLERGRWKSMLIPGLALGLFFGALQVLFHALTGQTGANLLFGAVWLLALNLAWGVALSWAFRSLRQRSPMTEVMEVEVREVQRLDRRQFLILLGSSAATITVVGTGLGALLARDESRRQGGAPAGSAETGLSGPPDLPNADDPVSPAPGTRPEYTPIEDHYKVFIELEPSVVDGETWRLPISGLVANPLSLTIDDLKTNYAAREQYVTISCISGRVGTTLIGTTKWTGVSLQDVLADAQVTDQARSLLITSADGFHESVDLALISADERIMLCYAWDDEPLPNDHGFPLRIWIPDRYGMKQPKWITGIEVTEASQPGYWVERGWDEVARVKSTSVIDTVAVDDLYETGGQLFIPVGGIAFSGAREISRVEVRVDGGPWEEAQLRKPLSETTWVIWRYDWPYEGGPHTFEVRCAEGDGTPQIEAEGDNRPSGATGIHQKMVET